MSEKTANEPTGEYYLQDVPELASGFKLDKDHGFQFFLSYGALDRYGYGKWQLNGSRLIFQSKPWGGKDFAMLESKTTPDEHITVRITDKNENIVRFVAASLKKADNGSWQAADSKGYIHFTKQDMRELFLTSEFSPERTSCFNIENPLHNYFEFGFEPWIMEYFFNDFSLIMTNEGLIGEHPLLEGDRYLYKKRTNKL